MYTSAQDVVTGIDTYLASADYTLPRVAYAIRCQTAGNVVVQTLAGQERTLAFLAGETREIFTCYIYKTGTTATGIDAMISPFAQEPNVIPTDNMTSAADIQDGSPSSGGTSPDGSKSPAGDGSDTSPQQS